VTSYSLPNKFISHNIVSLPKHFEELQSSLSNQLVDLLALRVNTLKDELCSIAGHDLLRNDRNRQGDGVAIYIRSTINYLIRRDLDLKGIEGICSYDHCAYFCVDVCFHLVG